MKIARHGVLICVVFLGAAAWAQANPPQAKAAAKPSAATPKSSSNLEALTRKGWDLFKAKDKAGYGKLLADEFTSVEADGKGPRDKNAAVAEAETFQINSYTISDYKTTSLGPNAALAHYSVDVDAVIDGKPLKAKLDVGEVWAKRGGEWKEVYYQESKRE